MSNMTEIHGTRQKKEQLEKAVLELQNRYDKAMAEARETDRKIRDLEEIKEEQEDKASGIEDQIWQIEEAIDQLDEQLERERNEKTDPMVD